MVHAMIPLGCTWCTSFTKESTPSPLCVQHNTTTLKCNSQHCIYTPKKNKKLYHLKNMVWATWLQSIQPKQQPLHCQNTPWPTKHTKSNTKCYSKCFNHHKRPHTWQPSYLRTTWNNIYLINYHIMHPSSKHNNLDILIISAMVNQIRWTYHKTTIQKV